MADLAQPASDLGRQSEASSRQDAQAAAKLAAKPTYQLTYLLWHLSSATSGQHRRRRGSGSGRTLWSPL
jgi:hypothetical protein